MTTLNNVPYRVTYSITKPSSLPPTDVQFYIGESPTNDTIHCNIFDAEGNQICSLQTPNSSTTYPSMALTGNYIRAEFWRSNQREPDWVIQINCPNGAETELADKKISFTLLDPIENVYLPGINSVLDLSEETSYVLCSDVQGYENFGQTHFSLQGWIQTTEAGCLLSLVNGTASPPTSVLSLCIEGGGNLAAWIQGERYGMDFGSSLTNGEWHSFNVTLDDTYLAFYIDAIWQGGVTLESTPILNSITEIVLGKGLTPDRGNLNSDEFNGLPLLGQFIGQIADIRIYPDYSYPTQTEMCCREYELNQSIDALGYWDFTTGTLNDQSEYGNNGTSVGTTFESVDLMPVLLEYSFRVRGFGNGANLGGQGGCMTFGTSAFFLQAWVRTTTGGGIVSCGAEPVENSDICTAGLSFAVGGDGSITVIVSDGADQMLEINTQSQSTVIDGGWHHIAVVNDGSGNWSIYLDGLLTHSAVGETPININPGSAPVKLGYTPTPNSLTLPTDSDDGSVPEDGAEPVITLKEVRIGSGMLTQTEIFQMMYQHFDLSYNSLLCYWSFASGNPVNSSARYADFLTVDGSECFVDDSLELVQPSYTVSNYCSVPNIVQYPFGNGAWTVESWVKSTDDSYYLFNAPLTGNSNYGVAANAGSNGTFSLVYFSTGVDQVSETTTEYRFQIPTLGDEVWHHIALVYTGSDYRLYVDGVSAPALTSLQTSMYSSTTSEFWIGNGANNYGQYFAEFRIWRIARTHADILTTMRQALSGNEYGLVACWGGTMGTGMDLSPNENGLDFLNKTGVCQYDVPINLPEASLWFDGSSSYATLGTPADLDFSGSVPYTVAAWINTPNPQNYAVFFSKNNHSVNGEYYLGLDGGKLRGGRQASPYSIDGTTIFEANQWYHVAMTYDGESLSLYVDGNLEASAEFGSVGQSGSSAEVVIGAMYSSGSPVNFFQGELSELTVWNQCLTSEEIWGVANHQLTSLLPAPVALWNFKAGTIADQSGNGNSMTLKGKAALIPSDFSFDQFSDVLSFKPGSYVDCGEAENLRFDGSVSLELWMRIEEWNENWEAFFGFNAGYLLKRNNATNGLAFTTDGISSAYLETDYDVTDGEWHHIAAVYDAESHAKYLYIDGVEQASQSGLSGTISYDDTTGFGIGGNLTDTGFPGWITEARVWNKALSLEDDILPHIDRKMVGNEPNLMGYWKCTTVDSSEVDLSSHGNNGVYKDSVVSDLAPFILLPPLPFLTARSKMIQDWTTESAESNDTQGRTVYQTVITLYSANGNPMPGENISIWCDEPTDIEVSGEYYCVSDSSALPLTTDPTGRITIATVAGALSTPALQLWAPFMKSDDRIIICPDDNVLDGLSVVGGDELQQSRNSQPPLLDPDYFSQQDADDLAEAVRNSVATVQTDGSTEEMARTPRYTGEKTRMVSSSSTVVRSMPDVSSFAYTVIDNQGFTRPVSPASGATDWALSFGSDSIWVDGEEISQERKVRFNRLTPEQIQAKLTKGGKPINNNSLELFSISDTWHKFTRSVEQFASVVVTTAETLGHEIENTVVVVLQEVDQEIEDAAQIIVDDIRQVGEFVVGTLSQAISSVIDEIEDVAQKVVAFFRDEFGWEDILTTKNAIAASLNQFAPAVEQIADDFITLLNQAFAALEEVTEDAFNALIADVGDMNIRSVTTPPDYMAMIPSLTSTALSTSTTSDGSSSSQPNISDLMSEFAVEANYLMSKLLGAADDGIRSADFTDFGDDIVEPVMGYLSTIIEKIVNSDAVQAFENAFNYIAEITSNPESFLQLMLQAFLSIVEGIALAGMEILQFGLDMLAQIVKLFIEGFQQMWTAPLEIPVVSWLYENVVTYDPSTGEGSQ
ncbi:MAG: LamG-like jellyroll fold domain-containing protein [Candidatus Kapaibacterium sp.]